MSRGCGILRDAACSPERSACLLGGMDRAAGCPMRVIFRQAAGGRLQGVRIQWGGGAAGTGAEGETKGGNE